VRAFCILLALCVPLFGGPQDISGDGVADWSGVTLHDTDGDGCFDPPGPFPPSGPVPRSDTLLFEKAWDSGTVLNNQWDACCGWFDGDSLLDILGHHWNPNQLHVFESDGAGGYEHVWVQTESLPPGSYGAVTAGDPDDDGAVELLGGDVSTLGKVVLFENSGDDTWADPHVLFQARDRLRALRVADTNRNDTNEVVAVTGTTGGGHVLIYEHSGAPGEHAYRLLYDYETVSYVFNGAVGDADNDGYPEVLLGVGGMHGYPMYIRRIVYDPVGRSYSHHLFESSVTGLHLTPLAADTDSSGSNELVVGSSGDYGQVHVFKYAGGDTFDPVWSSQMTTPGNVIAAGAGSFEGFPGAVVFAAPFGGAVWGLAWDGSAYGAVGYCSPGTGAAIRSVDVSSDSGPGADWCNQLVLAESAPADYVSVWRRLPGTGTLEPAGPVPASRLRFGPNPSRGPVRLEPGEPVVSARVFDATGRLVRLLRPDGVLSWDRRDARGVTVPAGVYLLEVASERGTSRARLVLLD